MSSHLWGHLRRLVGAILCLFVLLLEQAAAEGLAPKHLFHSKQVFEDVERGSSFELVEPQPFVNIATATGVADDDESQGAGARSLELERDAWLEQVFYKGDLVHFGLDNIEKRDDAFFVGLGLWRLGGWATGQYYLRVNPSLDLHFDVMQQKELIVRLSTNFNFLLCDLGSALGQCRLSAPDELRNEDFDELGDYLNVVQLVQFGRKEDRLFIRAGRLVDGTVGHGAVMRRYNANLDLDHHRVGLQFDAYGDYGGVETFIADVAMHSKVMGGLVFAKPLALLTDDPLWRSLSLGVHYTTDLSAPSRVLRDGERDDVLLDDSGYPEYESATLGIAGVNAEMKLVKLNNAIDLKIYADYSYITGSEGDGGLSAGILLRSNLGSLTRMHAIRARFEARWFGARYAPQYFGSFYEVEKFQTGSRNKQGHPITKYEEVVKTGYGEANDFTAYGELQYALVNRFHIGMGFGSMPRDKDGYHVFLSLEWPVSEDFRVYATYENRGLKSVEGLFSTQDTDDGSSSSGGGHDCNATCADETIPHFVC